MQRRLRSRLVQVVPALVLTMVLGSGCTKAPVSGVSVKSLAADLVFGIPELPEAVPPPNTDLSPDQPLGVIGTRGSTPQFPGGPVPPPPPECKEAEPTDFPEQEAPTVVQGTPKEGFYKWVVASEQQVQGVGPVVSHGFVERSIKDVEIVRGGVVQYTTVEQDLVFGAQRVVEQTYEVRQGAGQSDEGIYLVRRSSKTGTANPKEFVPTPAILMLDLPAKIGNTSNGTGVDPNTQEVQIQEGLVTKRHRVDVCGKVIDTWFVDAQQEFRSVTGETTNKQYDFAVATGMGGFIAFEHTESPRMNPRLKIDARLGQIEPDAKSTNR